MPIKKPSEFQIQRAVCIWLDGTPAKPLTPARPGALKPDAIYWHTPNGGNRDGREAVALQEMGVKAGVPDLVFLHHGKFYALEMKDDEGVVTKSQEKMMIRMYEAGAAGVAVAKSLAEAKAQIFAWGLALFP